VLLVSSQAAVEIYTLTRTAVFIQPKILGLLGSKTLDISLTAEKAEKIHLPFSHASRKEISN